MDDFKPLSYEDALALVQAFPRKMLPDLDALVQRVKSMGDLPEDDASVESENADG